MAAEVEWPSAEAIATPRLLLTPLRVEDAADVAHALGDPDLHRFTGGEPASVGELESRFEFQVVGHSPDRSQGWLNWVVRDSASGEVVGTTQATLLRQQSGLLAELAWVIATPWQGSGRAKETALAMDTWLQSHDVHTIAAHIHPQHAASAAVAHSLGMTSTDEVVDGEVRWVREE